MNEKSAEEHITALGHAMQQVYAEAERETDKKWYRRSYEWSNMLKHNCTKSVKQEMDDILIEAQKSENIGEQKPKQESEFGGGHG